MFSAFVIAGAVFIRPLGPHHGNGFDNPLFRMLSNPLFWGVLGVVAGPFLCFRGLQMLRLKRMVMDTPQSTVRAAALGNVEIMGTACGPYVLTAPLSGNDCFYYRLIVWAQHEGERRRIVEERCAPLFLDDGTGQMLVDPERARLNFASSTGSSGGFLDDVLRRHGCWPADVEEVREFCIAQGMKLFAFGTLADNPWAGDERDAGSAGKIGPYFSAEEADLQRREAYPTLDPTLPSGAVLEGAEKFDLYPPVILMKGNGPFVLAATSYREFVSGLRWKSAAWIWGGAAWAIFGVWQVALRFK